MMQCPSLTILLAANPNIDDLDSAKKLLNNQAKIISF